MVIPQTQSESEVIHESELENKLLHPITPFLSLERNDSSSNFNREK